MFHQFRREGRAAQERAEAAISLATEQGFPHWMAYGAILRGWALAQQGQAQEGIEQITQGLTSLSCHRSRDYATVFSGAPRRSHMELMGQPEAGLTVLTEALTLVDTTGERWYEPELYRLKGELLLQQSSDNQAEAETCFHQALDDRPKPTSQVLRITSRHQPRSPLAAARQTPGSP